MEWKKYRIKTTTQAEDYIGEILMEEGIYGFEVEDLVPLTQQEKEEMFIDLLPELPKDQGEAYITFYMETEKTRESIDQNEETLKRIIERIHQLGESIPVGAVSLEVSVTKEEDWVNNWKQYFKPFLVDDILIKPTWENIEPSDSIRMIIEIDPGTAFGTGRHETTRLCIRQLKKWIQEYAKEKGLRVLDAGCGSGILGIASIKLGADFVYAVDIDPRAVEAAKENRDGNHLSPEQMEVSVGNLLEDTALIEQLSQKKFHLIAANIFPEILIPLSRQLPSLLAAGGVVITSGILKERAREVSTAMEEQGIKIIGIEEDGDWVSVIGQKA